MDAIEISHYWPERLREKPQRAVRTSNEVGGIIAYLTCPSIGTEKDAHGAWSPGICRGDERADKNAERVTALAYDVDDCREGDVERSAEALAKYLAVIHTTFSATVERPKHRVVIFISRPLLPDEHRIAWPFGARVLLAAGIKVDAACKDLARLYYSPVVRPGGLWRARVCRGNPVDVDRMLVVAREQAEQARRAKPAPRARHRTMHASTYAQAALRRGADAVATAPEGQRNVLLNREAYALARLPDLRDDEIRTALTDAARAAGLPGHEIDKTIGSALRARRGVA